MCSYRPFLIGFTVKYPLYFFLNTFYMEKKKTSLVFEGKLGLKALVARADLK